MKPDAKTLLQQIAGKMLFDVGPQLPPGYGQGSVSTMGLLLIMLAQVEGEAIHWLREENESMRGLFRRALAKLDTRDDRTFNLTLELEALSKTTDGSLLRDDLEATHGALSRALIALHEHLERSTVAGGEALERAILQHLLLYSERRLIVLPAMP